MSVENAAAHLEAAYRSGEPVAPLSGTTPADTKDAYAIQAAVMGGLGAAVGGFKTGRGKADEVPVFAPIRAQTIVPSGATLPAAESRLRGVELEIGFRVDAALPAPDDGDFMDRLAERVVALPCLEIVEARLADPDAAPPLWKLADNQANGALVLGPPVTAWRDLNLTAPTARLQIGAQTVWDGSALAPGGNPFETFAAFVRTVGTHCGGLQPGMVVICGSLTGVDYAQAGEAVAGTISGLGRVTATFAG